MRGLVDFRTRIGPHRRCFYFSHEAMPREPLVMIHVALMDKIGGSVQVCLFIGNKSYRRKLPAVCQAMERKKNIQRLFIIQLPRLKKVGYGLVGTVWSSVVRGSRAQFEFGVLIEFFYIIFIFLLKNIIETLQNHRISAWE